MIDDLIAADPPSRHDHPTVVDEQVGAVTEGATTWRARCPHCATWTPEHVDRAAAVAAAVACCTTPKETP